MPGRRVRSSMRKACDADILAARPELGRWAGRYTVQQSAELLKAQSDDPARAHSERDVAGRYLSPIGAAERWSCGTADQDC